MKGVSEVIAIILILMITISLAGLAYMFMSTTMSDVTASAGSTVDTATTSMLTSFTIESMSSNVLYVRNTGQTTLSSLKVYVNDLEIASNITQASPAPGNVTPIALVGYIKQGDVVKVSSQSGVSATKVAPDQCLGAVACWHFDEGYGTIAHDSIGSSDGTLMNGPIWERGRYGYGLLLDGSNDFVDVLPSASVVNAMQTSGTVSMWVKTDFPSGSGAGTGKGFFQIGSSPGNSLEFYKHTNIANGPQFEVFYEGGYHKITPSVPVWDTIRGSWTHFVVTWQWRNATGYKEMKMFWNGTLIIETPTNLSSIQPSFSGNLSLGSLIGGGLPMKGVIDEVYIWDRAFSQSEIANLYARAPY